jgi:murein L,D-transpeptidase YcbB/YkuD
MTGSWLRFACCFSIPFYLLTGCRQPQQQIKSELQGEISSGHLATLKWPDFSDYQPLVQTFYGQRNFAPAWIANGKPTSQARELLSAFNDSGVKGLIPEDYDGARWQDRVKSVGSSPTLDAQFDLAMTVCAMRYISDLHIGRTNPKHFDFGIDVNQKKYDLPQFLSEKVVSASNVGPVLASVEPQADEYRRTEAALQKYIELAAKPAAAALPAVGAPVSAGGSYAGADELAARLQLMGDLDGNDGGSGQSQSYNTRLAQGVKSFQLRHGLPNDGKLTAQTIAALNVPLDQRVRQLDDTLERWRWLSDTYANAPIFVNLPEFALRAYGDGHKLDFMMAVIVGQALEDKKTPLIEHEMKYLVFRPYWNVPISIVRKELMKHVSANKGYLASHNFEVTNQAGKPVANWTAHELEQGTLMVREKPGQKNSLGLIKFMFPNEYDIYLHSTPAAQLFSHTKRDFSHGCIRVADPAKLAEWLLRDQPEWTAEKVEESLNQGPDNHTVNLKTPVPVVIFYATAFVHDDGRVYFFDDLYGYDQQLEDSLRKGPPYPQAPAEKQKSGDTV